MAKPGTNAARALASGAVDLGLRGMSDEQAAQVQEMIEARTGLRCMGCGRRIGLGFHFLSIDPRDPDRAIIRLAACTREECDFAEKCRGGATAFEAVEYAWCDPAGLDARAADLKKLGIRTISD